MGESSVTKRSDFGFFLEPWGGFREHSDFWDSGFRGFNFYVGLLDVGGIGAVGLRVQAVDWAEDSNPT